MAEIKTPNQLARAYLAAARQHLDSLLDSPNAILGSTQGEDFYWAVSNIHHAIEQVLAIVEASLPPPGEPDPSLVESLDVWREAHEAPEMGGEPGEEEG